MRFGWCSQNYSARLFCFIFSICCMQAYAQPNLTTTIRSNGKLQDAGVSRVRLLQLNNCFSIVIKAGFKLSPETAYLSIQFGWSMHSLLSFRQREGFVMHYLFVQCLKFVFKDLMMWFLLRSELLPCISVDAVLNLSGLEVKSKAGNNPYTVAGNVL